MPTILAKVAKITDYQIVAQIGQTLGIVGDGQLTACAQYDLPKEGSNMMKSIKTIIAVLGLTCATQAGAVTITFNDADGALSSQVYTTVMGKFPATLSRSKPSRVHLGTMLLSQAHSLNLP